MVRFVESFQKTLLSIFVCFLLVQCSSNSTPEQVDHIRILDEIDSLKNVNIYSTEIEPPYSVELIPEVIFESNKEVHIEGSLKHATVDDEGRVYIGATLPGKVGIYVFGSDGAFIKKISNYGRGPGEFEAISSILIFDKTLYVLDTRLHKIGFFSTDDFTHIKDELINKNQIEPKSKFTALMNGVSLNAIGESTLLMEMAVLNLNNLNEFDYRRIYPLNPNGEVGPNPILEIDRYLFYILKGNRNSDIKFGFTPPFSRNTLYETSEKGFIYTAWSENFLIKKYDSSGNYLSAYYYPYENSNLNIRELGLSQERLNIVEETEKPKKWPALYTLELDDEERLWVANITNSDSTYQWWVLDTEGQLMAKFELPGIRTKQSAFSGKPTVIIKNGYFYKREFDYNNDIDRIVKYRIVFKKRLE